MLQTIKDFFLTHTRSGSRTEASAPATSLELAAAVLMVEISMADTSQQSAERDVIKRALQDVFHLTAADTETIINLAQKEFDHAVSLHEFTSFLNQAMTAGERVGIVEILWRVAFADTVLDKYEEYYVRKIADLLYVPHREYIKAKHRAVESVASHKPHIS
ncbi:MAG: hypothetical protein HW386_776 [Gammaproteobacteria bacterium]|nr:hypothetical protein [Gammaproteobacteria bacterium]